MRKEKMKEIKMLIKELYDEVGRIETEEKISSIIDEIDFSAYTQKMREEEEYQKELDEEEEFLEENFLKL